MNILVYKCLEAFHKLFKLKDEQSKGGTSRLEKGLEKLDEANLRVSELK